MFPAKSCTEGKSREGIPACMSCHGPNGAGNSPAKYPALRGQHAMYTASQLNNYKNGTREPQYDEFYIKSAIR